MSLRRAFTAAWIALITGCIVSPKALPSTEAQFDADSIARKFHLALLHNRAANELRIWSESTNGAPYVDGWVVTPTGVTHCTTLHRIRQSIMNRPPTCEAAYNPGRAQRVLDYLPRLSQGVFKDCEVLDGSAVTIDGVEHGRRFTMDVNNPDVCHSEFKDIFGLLGDEWRSP